MSPKVSSDWLTIRPSANNRGSCLLRHRDAFARSGRSSVLKGDEYGAELSERNSHVSPKLFPSLAPKFSAHSSDHRNRAESYPAGNSFSTAGYLSSGSSSIQDVRDGL